MEFNLTKREFKTPLTKILERSNTFPESKYKITNYGAGILPFYTKNKNVYFLLGKDPDGKWSDFGGRAEYEDNNRWDITATREFYEETIGSVMDIQTMLSRLRYNKNFLKITDKTLNGSPYYMYVTNINYKDSYRYNFKSTYSFIKHISKNDKRIEYKYLEKIDIQWISIDTLKDAIESDDHSEYPLRTIFKRTLKGNIGKISEFCNNYNNGLEYII